MLKDASVGTRGGYVKELRGVLAELPGAVGEFRILIGEVCLSGQELTQIKNFGAVCGSISNNLLVIDVDNRELFSKLNLGELAGETFTVRTE